MTEPRQPLFASEPSADGPSGARALRILHQFDHPFAGAAVARPGKRAQAGKQAGGDRSTGGCGNADRECRRIQLMIGHEDEDPPDHVGAFGVEAPASRQAFMNRPLAADGTERGGQGSDDPRRIAAEVLGAAAETMGRLRDQAGERHEWIISDVEVARCEGNLLLLLPEQLRDVLERRTTGQPHGIMTAIDELAVADGGYRGRDRRLTPCDGTCGDGTVAPPAGAALDQRRNIIGAIEAAARVVGIRPGANTAAADIGVERLRPNSERSRAPMSCSSIRAC